MRPEATGAPAVPLCPVDDRQRTFLRRLVERTEDLARAINQTKAYADAEFASLIDGTVVSSTAGGSGVARASVEVAALRSQIVAIAEAHRAYGLSAEQVRYAIYLGATETIYEHEGAATWLYGNARAAD